MLPEGVCEGFVSNNKASEDKFDSGEDNSELYSLIGMHAPDFS